MTPQGDGERACLSAPADDKRPPKGVRQPRSMRHNHNMSNSGGCFGRGGEPQSAIRSPYIAQRPGLLLLYEARVAGQCLDDAIGNFVLQRQRIAALAIEMFRPNAGELGEGIMGR